MRGTRKRRVVLCWRRSCLFAFFWYSSLCSIAIADTVKDNQDDEAQIKDLPTLFLKVEELLHAGQAQNALMLLQSFPVDQKNDLFPSYLLQLGWVHLTLGNASEAISSLQTARERGLESDWIGIYLLQACLEKSDRACVDREFQMLSDDVLREHEGLGQLAVREAMEAKHWLPAWGRLRRLQTVSPDSRRYRVEGYRLYALLGLSQKLQVSLIEEIKKPEMGLTSDDLISVLAFAAQNGLSRVALNASEVFLARFRSHEEPLMSGMENQSLESIFALRGTLFQEQGEPRLSGESFAAAAVYNSKWHYAASRSFQTAEQMSLAVYHAGLIPDRQKQLEQRAILRLRRGEYDELAAMERSLSHAGLLKREDIRYAVAYAHFQHNNFADARKLLAEIQDVQLFEKATALRAEMQRQERKSRQ